MLKTSTILFMALILCGQLSAQGIKGNIKDSEGKPLPFASIYVKQAGTGTSSNLEGDYELPLKPGAYDVSFQFMGFASEQHRIQVGNGYTTLDITLRPQVYELPTVVVSGKAEDPSYTIMRKAIAKAKYHLLQNDSYTAQVYMKGTGQLTKVPWFLRKTLEKEGVDTSRVFTSESVSEISFERPNTFSERVISVRASGEDMANASPNSYINSSFYLPKVVNAISPLHPRAFSYYKFEYQGSFRENGYEVNKIKVTPRSKGDDVFEGEIYIREDFWNIYSLDLRTSIYGFEVQVQQIYAPIEDEVWMPVTQQYEFSGQIFGVAGKYSYLASVSNYEVVPNADLDASVVLVDEKIEPAPEEIEAIKEKNLEAGMEQVFEEEKEVSRKQFRKMMKEYEKQELEETEEPDVISDYSYKMDSLAAKKDSLYWESIRPVPLTSKEVAGYAKDDSTYVAEKIQAEADSNKVRNGQKFKPGQILTGSYYKLGKRLRYDFPGFLEDIHYNAVEGLNLTFTGTFQWRNDTTTRLRISPFVRYGFASEQPYAKLESVFGIGKAEERSTIRVSGGSYIEQFNPGIIDPLVGSLYLLLLERNYVNLYEKQFAKASFARRFKYRYTLGASVEYANRSELFNNTDYSFFDRDNRRFSDNAPTNFENSAQGFEDNTALITNVTLRARPWVKFRKYNGRLIPIYDRSPEFRLTYRKGINGLGSEVNFDHLELGLNAEMNLGVRAIIDVDAEVGKFFATPTLEFMDYKHFRGNRLEVSPMDVTGSYRMLDYYKYSTSQEYASILTHIRFRKLAFTHIPAVRLLGIKENLFVNYLHTPTSDNYMEVGYTIDNLFRIFRLELVQSFQGWKAKDFGVRIGVSSIFDN
ncbi:DUF5686 and carboxypeptidase regulatory-like domain-containing protein [Roseivirga spongicola]|uniref:DUF5686 and carboxypeptidase regulatory-like domain-containing protein n=1 Tax=Roseivirga spongicola TaxID=333140 RepID=UPI002AC8FD02|nr:DUF5686 and carboxypeptidase regulatory-like domain-containing protein [Roseivirga spongicola]WPZ08592.1 DUF5686 and carboxypeptidase regulatory-like domain-containing protein [Roseivirga spongicola]